MPPTKKNRARDPALPTIPSELIDQIVKCPTSADAVNAASKAFKKALIERCLGRNCPTTSDTLPAPRCVST